MFQEPGQELSWATITVQSPNAIVEFSVCPPTGSSTLYVEFDTLTTGHYETWVYPIQVSEYADNKETSRCLDDWPVAQAYQIEQLQDIQYEALSGKKLFTLPEIEHIAGDTNTQILESALLIKQDNTITSFGANDSLLLDEIGVKFEWPSHKPELRVLVQDEAYFDSRLELTIKNTVLQELDWFSTTRVTIYINRPACSVDIGYLAAYEAKPPVHSLSAMQQVSSDRVDLSVLQAFADDIFKVKDEPWCGPISFEFIESASSPLQYDPQAVQFFISPTLEDDAGVTISNQVKFYFEDFLDRFLKMPIQITIEKCQPSIELTNSAVAKNYTIGYPSIEVSLPKVEVTRSCGTETLFRFETVQESTGLTLLPLEDLISFDESNQVFHILKTDQFALKSLTLEYRLDFQVNSSEFKFRLQVNYQAGGPRFVEKQLPMLLVQIDQTESFSYTLPPVYNEDQQDVEIELIADEGNVMTYLLDYSPAVRTFTFSALANSMFKTGQLNLLGLFNIEIKIVSEQLGTKNYSLLMKLSNPLLATVDADGDQEQSTAQGLSPEALEKIIADLMSRAKQDKKEEEIPNVSDAPTLKISKVSYRGLVVVDFSDELIVPTNTINLQTKDVLINGVLKDYLELDVPTIEEQTRKQVSFSWEVTSFTESQLKIQVYFDDYQTISLDNEIVLKFWHAKSFTRLDDGVSIETGTILKHFLPVQQEKMDPEEVKSVGESGETIGDGGQVVMAISGVLTYLKSSLLSQVLGGVQNLQIIMHFLMLNIFVPEIAQVFFGELFSLVTFELFHDIDSVIKLAYGIDKEEVYSDNAEQIGYESKLAIYNSGSVQVVTMFLLVSQILFYLLRKFYPKRLTTRRCDIRRYAKRKQADFIWGGAGDFIEETYFLFAISFALNYDIISFSSPGLAVNASYAIFGAVIVAVYPLLLVIKFYLTWKIDVNQIDTDLTAEDAFVDQIYMENPPESVQVQIDRVVNSYVCFLPRLKTQSEVSQQIPKQPETNPVVDVINIERQPQPKKTLSHRRSFRGKRSNRSRRNRSSQNHDLENQTALSQSRSFANNESNISLVLNEQSQTKHNQLLEGGQIEEEIPIGSGSEDKSKVKPQIKHQIHVDKAYQAAREFNKEYLLRRWIDKSLADRFGGITSQIGSSQQVSREVAAVFILCHYYRRMLFALIIVSLAEKPYTQVLLCLLIQSIYIWLLAGTQVIANKRLRYEKITSEVSVVFFIYFMVVCIGNFVYMPGQRRMIGIWMIGLAVANLSAHFMLGLFDILYAVYRRIRQKYVLFKAKKAIKAMQKEIIEERERRKALKIERKQAKRDKVLRDASIVDPLEQIKAKNFYARNSLLLDLGFPVKLFQTDNDSASNSLLPFNVNKAHVFSSYRGERVTAADKDRIIARGLLEEYDPNNQSCVNEVPDKEVLEEFESDQNSFDLWEAYEQNDFQGKPGEHGSEDPYKSFLEQLPAPKRGRSKKSDQPSQVDNNVTGFVSIYGPARIPVNTVTIVDTIVPTTKNLTSKQRTRIHKHKEWLQFIASTYEGKFNRRWRDATLREKRARLVAIPEEIKQSKIERSLYLDFQQGMRRKFKNKTKALREEFSECLKDIWFIKHDLAYVYGFKSKKPIEYDQGLRWRPIKDRFRQIQKLNEDPEVEAKKLKDQHDENVRKLAEVYRKADELASQSNNTVLDSSQISQLDSSLNRLIEAAPTIVEAKIKAYIEEQKATKKRRKKHPKKKVKARLQETQTQSQTQSFSVDQWLERQRQVNEELQQLEQGYPRQRQDVFLSAQAAMAYDPQANLRRVMELQEEREQIDLVLAGRMQQQNNNNNYGQPSRSHFLQTILEESEQDRIVSEMIPNWENNDYQSRQQRNLLRNTTYLSQPQRSNNDGENRNVFPSRTQQQQRRAATFSDSKN